VPTKQDEKARTATELRDLANKFWKPEPGKDYKLRFLDPLPKEPFFIDYTDQLPSSVTIYKNRSRELALNPPSFIHDRNHEGECYICDNYYEIRRATMIAEAGTEL
jgi:hypothetical protein